MMNGNSPCLNIYLGKNTIAQLTLEQDQLYWQYTQNWQNSGYALSPHLPLKDDIPTINVQRFLRNLLPEGNGLDELISIFHLSKYNTFGLIRALGKDIPGALLMIHSEQSFPLAPSFRIITHEELEQRLNKRDEFSLIVWDGKPRLSVAGVQDKINVLLTPEGELGFGEGSLCSTHILKFEKQKLSHLVINEYLSMQLAKHCGLNVAEVKLMRYGTHSGLLIERFDRHLISMAEIKRRHIIDGCQVLNLSPEYKYERNFGSNRDVAHIREGASLVKLFEFTNQCTNPALTRQQILDWVLFNLLIFNYDAHAKNISFFVGPKGISLAPFYDLVNIKMYPDFEHEMAMALGDEFDGMAVHAYQLADFADSCSLPRALVAKRLASLINKVVAAISLEVQQIKTTDEELSYLNQYKTLVLQRCDYLLTQIGSIISIRL